MGANHNLLHLPRRKIACIDVNSSVFIDPLYMGSFLASTPGSLGGGEREPGTHCLRMRQNLRKPLRKTIRLLLTSTWFIYIYVVYQVQIRRLNKVSARSSSLWLLKD